MSIFIYRTTISTGVFISNFFSISAIFFRMLASQKVDDLNFPLIFLIIPFFHIVPPILFLFERMQFMNIISHSIALPNLQ